MSIKVEAKVYSDGRIDLTTLNEQDDIPFPQKIYQQVIYTQEHVIKQALIDLGWTPPPTGPLIVALKNSLYVLERSGLDTQEVRLVINQLKEALKQ